jgi:hypothetical protein
MHVIEPIKVKGLLKLYVTISRAQILLDPEDTGSMIL